MTERLEPITLFDEEGPGIIVLAKNANVGQGGFGADARGNPMGVIDGFTVSGGDNAGGIMVNGYAHRLVVSNNRVQGNAGTFGGGIRVGHPRLLNAAGTNYQSSFNDRIRISRNQITRNGGIEAVGGGVSLYTGAARYEVTDNFICGNFTGGHGGGIGHLGLSDRGLIARNTIVFNETFYQASSVGGGGIYIGGAPPVGANPLSPGAGNVKIDRNVIQGNGATSGDGGGIRIERANGRDVAAAPRSRGAWYQVDITNNLINNNVAAMAGGGLSLQDAALVNIVHNTVVRNDSTATAGNAFTPGVPSQSNPQPAGIVSYAHTPALAAAFARTAAVARFRVFSNPYLINDIIWQNRSFHFEVLPTTPNPSYVLLPDVAGGDAPTHWDLAVLGGAATLRLDPRNCVLTDMVGYATSNFDVDPPLPLLVASYENGSANLVELLERTTGIDPPPAFDEGGNFIKVRFGPITRTNPTTGMPFANSHLATGTPAVARGMPLFLLPLLTPEMLFDFDGQLRPLSITTRPDVGADQR